MSGDGLAGQLATLAEALKRLEAELAGNASWSALQSDAALSEADVAAHLKTLEANPVYLAWRNMREAADMLEARAVPAKDQAVAPDTAPMASTLAQALQDLPEEEAVPEPLPQDIARLLAAEVAAQLVPQTQPAAAAHSADLRTAKEREEYGVGQRATEAVERILATPENPSPTTQKPEAAPGTLAAALAQPMVDDIGHSVPLEAEDLAFLLKPAARVQPAEPSPFLKRLVSETQTPPTRTAAAPSAPDPFMVPPPATPAPEPESAPPPPGDKDDGGKPRLARLLKGWSRH